ncbi:MAG: tetratricopeptide repeat protein [Deltaproteobacteria bacterium]|nr:tetratricopeptide repeat protein [Deltaproteobacteria bacterium]
MFYFCILGQPPRGDTVTNLLEEGIYAEDTKGDLDEAITIYKKIIDENEGNRINISKAYYRLGTCYLKSGDEAKAIEMFKQLLNRFPEQVEVINDAKIQLSRLGISDDGNRDIPLEIGPAPWEVGETCWYGIKSPPTMSHVKMIMSVKNIIIKDNDLWRFSNYLVISTENQSQLSRIDVSKKDFMPVSGLVRSGFFNNKAQYNKDHIDLNYNFQGKTDIKEIPLSNNVYDNEQVLYLIRRLPLEDNYVASFSIFSMQNGQIIKSELKTTGKETISVSAGTFECYGVELKLESGIKQKMWLSADDKKYLVKIETPQTIMELEKAALVSAGEPELFRDNEFGISMSAPESWHIVKSPISGQYKMVVIFAPPEIDTWFPFFVIEHGGTIKQDSMRDAAEAEVNLMKQTFKKFSVEPSSWKAGVISGMQSLSYIAEFDDKGKKMVDCRTHILGKSLLYSFLIRTEKEIFEKNKQEYNSIIQSLRVYDK